MEARYYSKKDVWKSDVFQIAKDLTKQRKLSEGQRPPPQEVYTALKEKARKWQEITPLRKPLPSERSVRRWLRDEWPQGETEQYDRVAWPESFLPPAPLPWEASRATLELLAHTAPTRPTVRLARWHYWVCLAAPESLHVGERVWLAYLLAAYDLHGQLALIQRDVEVYLAEVPDSAVYGAGYTAAKEKLNGLFNRISLFIGADMSAQWPEDPEPRWMPVDEYFIANLLDIS